MTRKFAVTDVYCLDASKSVHPISTGIGYLDHMIDQLNSHAQVGVSVTVIVVGNDDDAGAAAADDAPALGGKHEGGGDDDRGRQRRHPSSEFVNRYANEDQSEILSLVGSALGERLGALLSADRSGVCAGGGGDRRRFRQPLPLSPRRGPRGMHPDDYDYDDDDERQREGGGGRGKTRRFHPAAVRYISTRRNRSYENRMPRDTTRRILLRCTRPIVRIAYIARQGAG